MKGSTVTASAPPKAAAAHAAVVRSMLVHGSRFAIMRPDVTAVMCIVPAGALQASAMRAMIVRAARTLAAPRNKSVSTASAKAICENASLGETPAASNARR